MQCFFVLFGSATLSAPFVGLFLLFVIGGWIVAVKSLGKQFTQLTSQDEKITIPEEKAPSLTEPAKQGVL